MSPEHRGEPADAQKLAELQLLAERGRETGPEEIDVNGQGRASGAARMLEVTASRACVLERKGRPLPGGVETDDGAQADSQRLTANG